MPQLPTDVYVNHATEDELLKYVTDRLRLGGWWWFHDTDSRQNNAGLLDIIAVRPPRVIFAELKTAKGRLRREQAEVLAKLQECPGVEVFLWRPLDLDQIDEVLR